MIEGAHRNELVLLIIRTIGEPRHGVEVGVDTGKTSHKLLRSFVYLRLSLVDHWPDDERYRIASNRIRRFAHRTVFNRMDAVAGAATLDDNSQDFAFIDDDHTHEGCQRSIAAYWPKVRPGGLFCGHDYGKPDFPGVTQAVTEFAELTGQNIQATKIGHIWWTLKPAS